MVFYKENPKDVPPKLLELINKFSGQAKSTCKHQWCFYMLTVSYSKRELKNNPISSSINNNQLLRSPPLGLKDGVSPSCCRGRLHHRPNVSSEPVHPFPCRGSPGGGGPAPGGTSFFSLWVVPPLTHLKSQPFLGHNLQV